ncbi:caspase family protein [Saccharopolyspora shandongensis]|uniref:caspase family protein n=1 Tax=Saccharopolyspora shandongensis TaxID=418495 RepID=UPI0033EC32D0
MRLRRTPEMRLPDGERSRAVLIGSSSFADPDLPDLPAVSNNLGDLASALTDPLRTSLPRKHCTLLHDPEGLEAVGDALDAASKQAQDMLLVYYAGHGLLDRKNELHLSLPRSRRDRVRLSAVPYSHIREVMLRAQAANRIVILDCCFSGRALGEAMAEVNTLLPGQIEIAGTCTLTSTSATELALAPEGERWTAFTGELIRTLQNGVDDDSKLLTLDSIYLHLDCAMNSRGLPRPDQCGSRTAGKLALARNPVYSKEDTSTDASGRTRQAFPNNELLALNRLGAPTALNAIAAKQDIGNA